MKKIIFFDVDGTLLDHSIGLDNIPERTKEAVELLDKAGNYCIVATARTNLTEELRNLPFAGMVLSNGNYIEFLGNEIHNKFFSIEQLNNLAAVLKKYNGAYIMGGYHDILVSDTEDILIKKHDEIYGKPDYKPGIPVDEKINAVTALFNNKKDMYNTIENLPSEWSYHIYESPNTHVDIYLPGFSKGTAVKHLYEYLKIPYENTYAFGDGKNDKEMMELVKYSTAMGNAVAEIKDIAYMTTDAVNNNGIYNALKKYKLI
jgi:Cof subfamily protein (haloacid dehalogenase superfamily)